MSDSSELGPIDPQLVRRSPSGELSITGVQHHLDAYQRYRSAYLADPSDHASAMMLAKFEPAEIQAFESVMARARQLSDKHLNEGMFRRGHPGAYTAITSSLLDTKRWLTHTARSSARTKRKRSDSTSTTATATTLSGGPGGACTASTD